MFHVAHTRTRGGVPYVAYTRTRGGVHNDAYTRTRGGGCEESNQTHIASSMVREPISHAREVVGVKSPIWSEIVVWSSSIQIQLGLGVESGAPRLSLSCFRGFIHTQADGQSLKLHVYE
jgi:hypothetical protein